MSESKSRRRKVPQRARAQGQAKPAQGVDAWAAEQGELSVVLIAVDTGAGACVRMPYARLDEALAIHGAGPPGADISSPSYHHAIRLVALEDMERSMASGGDGLSSRALCLTLWSAIRHPSARGVRPLLDETYAKHGRVHLTILASAEGLVARVDADPVRNFQALERDFALAIHPTGTAH